MILSNIYHFYEKLSEEERVSLIGSQVIERELHYKTKTQLPDQIYYPVGLSEDCFNYGYRQGLISLLQPYCLYWSKASLQKYKDDATWMKIYAFSPDDLDLALHFENNKNPEKLYKNVIKFLDEWSITFTNISYKEILIFCQKEFGGEIGL